MKAALENVARANNGHFRLITKSGVSWAAVHADGIIAFVCWELACLFWIVSKERPTSAVVAASEGAGIYALE